MAIKSVTYQFKGMNRDLSNINASNQFAYEIRNMKITTDKDNTLLSISTNKGTKKTNIKLLGTPIGHATIENDWVIFCAGTSIEQGVADITAPQEGQVDFVDNSTEIPDIRFTAVTDYIYKITKTSTGYNSYHVFGNLGFNTESPIETVVFVENEELKKVYWTDNKNQLRFIRLDRINTLSSSGGSPITSSEIDFIPESQSNNEQVEISKDSSIIGLFTAGTTQYAFSYINYYGQQSNLFHISSIYYNVSNDISLAPNNTSSDCYKIEISNLNNTDYQYVRIYSIVRTSQDSVPDVRVVKDVKLEGTTLEYIDRHNTGYSIDPTELFYIGGEQLIVGTMTQKDNTLFIGDITQKKEVLPESIIQRFYNNNNIITKFILDSNKYITENAGETFYAQRFKLKDTPSEKLTTFKTGDYYRIGVQLMHKSGRWSEPIYIGDYKNTQKIKCGFDTIDGFFGTLSSHYHQLISIKTTIKDNDLLQNLTGLGYTKIRPIIVYPELEDRVTLCQGYLCPTVYNIGERCNNGIWVQSSWFARPFTTYKYNPSGYQSTSETDQSKQEQIKGSALEFRHNAYIGGMYTHHLEIQGADRYDTDQYNNYQLVPVQTLNKIQNYIKEHSHQFFVDNSIVTLHSPEIEFDESLSKYNLEKYKLRIIGYLPLTSNQGNIDLSVSTAGAGYHDNASNNDGFTPLSGDKSTGFFKNIRSNRNYSNDGHRILCSGFFYRDGYNWQEHSLNFFGGSTLYPYKKFEIIMGYNISPFQAGGSIKGGDSSESKIQYKKLSNVRYSYGQKYFDDTYVYDTEDCQVYNFETNDVKYINIGNKSVQYSGNIDTVLTCKHINGQGSLVNGCRTYLFPNVEVSTISQNALKTGTNMTPDVALSVRSAFNDGAINTNPIVMRYKSTPHIVISLSNKEKQQILPVVKDNLLSHWWTDNGSTHYYVWDKEEFPKKIKYDKINSNLIYSGLFLAELYQDSINTDVIFGGNNPQAIANNKWVIAGKEESINTIETTLYYTEGDTYYQRYDNLKTYPWSMEEVNGVTDVISFMVETRINLEGRYDSNKADRPHFHILPSNFNLINKAYTQKNNFFSYYGIDYDRINIHRFPNLVSWSKTKTAGELIDMWLNLNLSSTLDLDGSNGKIVSLQNYNDDILAFQEKSLGKILYNEQTLISTTQGVPIEIANSGKVGGYKNISNNIGCSNKWSICNTPNGLYFLDSYNKDLYRLGESLENLSNTNGFNSYLRTIQNIHKPWNPSTLDSIKTSYDPINKEVLFSTKNETLSYSEQLQTFMSFYDFNIDYFTTLQGDSLVLTNNNKNIYEYQKDKHNFYFDKVVPYSIEFVSNPDPLKDKIFNTLEFRSDSWYDDSTPNAGKLADFETFDNLYISNEYQNTFTTLTYHNYGLSNLKKRFRIWRTLIPRDNSYPNDRIRNTWTKIKLERSRHALNNCKTVLHDVTVYYNI